MTAIPLTLDQLKIYQLSRDLGRIVWSRYQSLDWHNKKIMGDQWMESTDSVGANIAEGHGRFHFLDRAKFLYNSRGSLLESKHWFDVFCERDLLELEFKQQYLMCYHRLHPSLNRFIQSVIRNKYDQS